MEEELEILVVVDASGKRRLKPCRSFLRSRISRNPEMSRDDESMRDKSWKERLGSDMTLALIHLHCFFFLFFFLFLFLTPAIDFPTSGPLVVFDANHSVGPSFWVTILNERHR